MSLSRETTLPRRRAKMVSYGIRRRNGVSSASAFLARLLKEPESDDGWTEDEGAPSKGAGHADVGPPTQVGVGDTVREYCDGQSLASPGRWTQQ